MRIDPNWLREAKSFLPRAFENIEALLTRFSRHPEYASVVARGSRGVFDYCGREGVKRALRHTFRVEFEQLDKDDQDLLMDILDINIRALRNFYDAQLDYEDARDNETRKSDFVHDQAAMLAQAYINAFRNWANSKGYDSVYGKPPKIPLINTEVLAKQFGLAALNQALNAGP